MPNIEQTKTEWPWKAEAPKNLRSGQLPRISIVTPSYNQGKFIEETIRSIVLQEYPNLEYVIMDGGSTDETCDVIRKYGGQITFWVSEKDRGQSHAINKGIARCTGDLFNWINSDDYLAPNALWHVAEAWLASPGRIVAGHTWNFNESGRLKNVLAKDQTLRNFVRFWEAKEFGWSQPSTFVPLADVKAVGGIREDLTFCMDYHMMIQLLRRGLQVSYVDEHLAAFRLHSDSKTVGSKAKFRLERIKMMRALTDTGVEVTDREWDREQARRLVDVARHVQSNGDLRGAFGYFLQACRLSPTGALQETVGRAFGKFSGNRAAKVS